MLARLMAWSARAMTVSSKSAFLLFLNKPRIFCGMDLIKVVYGLGLFAAQCSGKRLINKRENKKPRKAALMLGACCVVV